MMLRSLATRRRALVAEVVVEVLRGGPDALQIFGEAGKGSLTRCAVQPAVIDILQPQIQDLVELRQGCRL